MNLSSVDPSSLSGAKHRGFDISERDILRFLSKCSQNPWTGCWIWLANRQPDGYGQFGFPVKMVRAHRFSYSLFVEDSGVGNCKDDVIMHDCNVPMCVNPSHLRRGTQLENIKQVHLAGRWKCKPRHGEVNSNSKLDDGAAIRIINMIDQGFGCVSLSSIFGVSESSISSIKHNRTWRHLPRPWLGGLTPIEYDKISQEKEVDASAKMRNVECV